MVVIPRNRWEYGGRELERAGRLLDDATGRLYGLGWAGIALGVPLEYIDEAPQLDTLRKKLRAAGREVPEPLEQRWKEWRAAVDAVPDADDTTVPRPPLLDRGTGRLRPLRWACLALGVPWECLDGAEELGTVRDRLRTRDRTLPEPMERIRKDPNAEATIALANTEPAAADPNGTRKPTSRAACERRVAAAGKAAGLTFVFVDG